MNFKTIVSFWALLGVLSLQFASTAVAQERSGAAGSAGALEEIVVTARKRAQSIQDVSMSITAFSGEQVEEFRIINAQDLSWFTPGLFATGSRGDADPLYTIRGIGLNDAFSNNNPTVGVYFNEVNQPYTPMMAFQLFDLDRVEVLKGPQGTLYGRNTTGGAINVFSRRPGEEVNGYVRGDVGNYDRYELEAAVGGPLSDQLGGRISFLTIQQNEGWVTNAFNGQEIGELDQTAVRGTLDWNPNDDVNVLFVGYYARDKSDSAAREHVGFADGAFSPNLCAPALRGERDESQCVSFLGYSDPFPDRYTVENSSIFGQESDGESFGVSLAVNWQIGDMTLSSVTGYSDYDRVYTEDSDGTPIIMIDTQSTNEIEVFSQELRLAATTEGGLDWVVGAYFTDDEMFFDFQQALDEHIFLTRISQNFTQSTTAWAVFGYATLPLSDRWSLVGGLRYTDEEKDFDYFGFDHDPFGTTTMPAIGVVPVPEYHDSISHDAWTGELGLEYHISDESMVYANVSKGFKSGGYKGAVSFTEAELEPFEPETLYAYEVGIKSTLADGSVRLNAAAYYYDWEDFQAFVTEIRGGVPVLVLSNAGDAEVTGAEVDLLWQPTERLQLGAGLNWMDTEITKYNAIPGTGDNAGNKLANSPDLMFNGRARYEFPVGDGGWTGFVAADAMYRDDVFFSLGNNGQNSQDAFWLWNGRIGFISPDGHWDVSVWGKNLGDKFYITQSYDNTGGIFPSQNFLGMPRTYGVSVKYSF
ncbi:TonB-dependent receptor [Elongatibacter sediminis]|uniref:TonB-dependent receptor n=1 Tax=Elongatibacter sediminis TaxID=3119006 RepID=A0AAW9RCR2_9GAMM